MQLLDVIIAIARVLVDFCGAAQSREVSGPFHAFATAAGSHGAFYLREKSRARTAQSTVSPERFARVAACRDHHQNKFFRGATH